MVVIPCAALKMPSSRLLLHLITRRAFHHELFDGRGDRQCLVDTHAPCVAARGFGVSFGVVERDVFPRGIFCDSFFFFETTQDRPRINTFFKLRLFVAREFVFLRAFCELAHEALPHANAERGDKQEWLDAHIEQARNSAGCGICVQGRKHQVAGQCGVDGERCGLFVADLPHHDDVGILTHETSQAVGKREADLGAHLRLIDTRHLIFDRIFNSRDVDVGRVDEVEERVERR